MALAWHEQYEMMYINLNDALNYPLPDDDEPVE